MTGGEQKLRRSSSLQIPPTEASLIDIGIPAALTQTRDQIYSNTLGFNEDASKYLDSSILQTSIDENGVWNSMCFACCMTFNFRLYLLQV